jgi:molybdopterin/thiamine biosynthesis adenylyltransferase
MPRTIVRSYQLKIMATLTDVAPVSLNNDEILRYSRHLIMPEVGMEGQLKLKAAKVLCIGAGGLGSPLALYLGAAGVGTLGLVDFDVVDYTNLQRQIIHRTEDVGRPKLDSAASSACQTAPATAASIPSRRRRGWFPRAPKVGC